ncbi:MAG: CoA transferase [Pigmentiphaga sp.]
MKETKFQKRGLVMSLDIDGVAPLAGIKVVELGLAMAGPYCSMMLADYGADVVKIERMDGGDISRNWAPDFPGGVSYYFAAANRNKRSFVVDMKHPDGAEALQRLLASADVVVDNFRVGVLDKLGLGYEALRKKNRRLIYCSISGFGPDGPRKHDRANDIFMQAFAGNMSVTGEPDGGPCKSGISVADIGAGMFGAFGILLALEARHRTGEGQRVDTSLLEGQVAMLSYHFTKFFATGRAPGRTGAAMELSAAYRAFQAADDWFVVAAFTDAMWAGVCRAVGRSEWITDPRFESREGRVDHVDTLIQLLGEVFATRPAGEWIERLAAEGVPSTRVNTIDKVAADEQVLARDMIVSVDHPLAGEIRMAGLPVKLSRNPGEVRLPAPMMGEHTAGILRELGYSDAEIIHLLNERAVAGPAPEAGASMGEARVQA